MSCLHETKHDSVKLEIKNIRVMECQLSYSSQCIKTFIPLLGAQVMENTSELTRWI